MYSPGGAKQSHPAIVSKSLESNERTASAIISLIKPIKGIFPQLRGLLNARLISDNLMKNNSAARCKHPLSRIVILFSLTLNP